MSFIQRKPAKFEAVQFTKEGDHPLVKRGYRNRSGMLISSDGLPRTPECKFAWVLNGPHNFEEVKVGDWIVQSSKTPRLTIFTDVLFKEEFVEETSEAEIFQ